MLYMVVEKYRNGDPIPVYRRFRDRGRMMPTGLSYLGSWVSEDLSRCFQVVECENREDLDEWISSWKDLVDFEVVGVVTSAEAQASVAPRL
jgi:Domain of unknown function (DUF3303)